MIIKSHLVDRKNEAFALDAARVDDDFFLGPENLVQVGPVDLSEAHRRVLGSQQLPDPDVDSSAEFLTDPTDDPELKWVVEGGEVALELVDFGVEVAVVLGEAILVNGLQS